jgi:hypothetical protein
MSDKLLGILTDGELGTTATQLEKLKHIELDSNLDGEMEDSGPTEAVFKTDQVSELARTSLDFLAGLSMPLVFKFCFPPVFISIWLWLVSFVHKARDFSQLAIGLPRGFGKTSVIKLFILYCILFTKKQFILVINDTAAKAENTLSDVIDMLEEPNIKAVFGDWRLGIEKDTQEIKKFGYRGRNIILAALGAGSSMRGLNIKNARPDVMIFDDIQSRETADSEILSTNLEKWLVGTAMKAKSPTGCLYIFLANMYPTKWSLLKRLKANPTWVKFIAGGILSDGTSLWEELQPIEQLKKEFQNDLAMGRPEIFYSEVLNDENASVNNLVDFSKIPKYTRPDDSIPDGKFVLIDPANNKVNSDSTAISYNEVFSSIPVMRKLTNKKLSPGDTIRQALTYCLENNCKLVVIESVAYQASLCYWFNFICQQLGITGIEVVEIHPGRYSKNHRIMTMFKQLPAGEIEVHPECMPEVTIEILGFNPMKTDNTDNILDVLTYMSRCVAEFGEHMVAFNDVNEMEFSGASVIEDNCVY